MGRQFDEDDEEYIELLKEYEKYVRDTRGAIDDFDDWLEYEYGANKKKKNVMRKSDRTHRYKGD